MSWIAIFGILTIMVAIACMVKEHTGLALLIVVIGIVVCGASDVCIVQPTLPKSEVKIIEQHVGYAIVRIEGCQYIRIRNNYGYSLGHMGMCDSPAHDKKQ